MVAAIAFGNGDLVEVEAASVRAVARVRESSLGGRLHIAFEMGEYLPWIDADVQIRHVGTEGVPRSARILHAGATTALLQMLDVIDEVPPSSDVRAPLETLPVIDEA